MSKPNWVFKFSLGETKCHHLLYCDEELGVQMEIHTRKLKNDNFGKGRVYYFIDGDKREFRTEEELMAACRQLEKERK